MPSSAPILARIRSDLIEAVDPSYRDQIHTLVPGVRALGVRVPVIRAQVLALARAEPALGFEQVCALADALCRSGAREEHLFASFLLARFRKPLATLPWARIARWCQGIDNWETCDQLAMNVAAPRIAAEPALVVELLVFARERNPWRRRFALATAAALNQKGRAMPAEALRVCTELVRDAEPTVRKALGWALREASEADPDLVFAFLDRHRAVLHPTVLREGSEKLPESLRARLRRG